MTKAQIISLISLLLVSSSSMADENGYQFNDSGKVKPEFDKSVHFTAPPEGEKDKKLDLVKDADSKTYYTSELDYPKSGIYFSYNPGIDGFTNNLSGTRSYNYGGSNFSGLSAGYIYSPSVASYLTLDATYEKISVPTFSDTGAGILVKASDAEMLDVMASFNFCQVYESTYHKLCPGLEINYDSFPTLSFPQNSNSQISLQTIHDMTVGLNLAYGQKLGQNFQLISKLAYNYGLNVGQASDLGTKSDQKISARVGLERPWTEHWIWNASIGADYRTANLRNTNDSWSIQDLQYNLRLGFRYEF